MKMCTGVYLFRTHCRGDGVVKITPNIVATWHVCKQGLNTTGRWFACKCVNLDFKNDFHGCRLVCENCLTASTLIVALFAVPNGWLESFMTNGQLGDFCEMSPHGRCLVAVSQEATPHQTFKCDFWGDLYDVQSAVPGVHFVLLSVSRSIAQDFLRHRE